MRNEVRVANPIDDLYYDISHILGMMLFVYVASHSSPIIALLFVCSMLAVACDKPTSYWTEVFRLNEFLYTGVFYIPIKAIMRFTWNF
jgi:hypothetical protein